MENKSRSFARSFRATPILAGASPSLTPQQFLEVEPSIVPFVPLAVFGAFTFVESALMLLNFGSLLGAKALA